MAQTIDSKVREAISQQLGTALPEQPWACFKQGDACYWGKEYSFGKSIKISLIKPEIHRTNGGYLLLQSLEGQMLWEVRGGEAFLQYQEWKNAETIRDNHSSRGILFDMLLAALASYIIKCAPKDLTPEKPAA
jgi:hypothetical protein